MGGRHDAIGISGKRFQAFLKHISPALRKPKSQFFKRSVERMRMKTDFQACGDLYMFHTRVIKAKATRANSVQNV